MARELIDVISEDHEVGWLSSVMRDVDLPKDVDGIIGRYIRGESLKDIAKSLDVSEQAIYRRMRKCNFKYRRTGWLASALSERQIDQACENYALGDNLEALSKQFRVSPTTMRHHLRQRGLEIRDSRHRVSNGCIIKDANGEPKYRHVLVREDDPMASMRNSLGYVAEHRLVVARLLGRPLVSQETVHHIDNNGLNNDINNLQLRSSQHGTGAVAECGSCGSKDIRFLPIADPDGASHGN